jgi:hypothetical protein
MMPIQRWADLVGRRVFQCPFQTDTPFEPWEGNIGGFDFKPRYAEALSRSVGDPPDKRALWNAIPIELRRLGLVWPEIVRALDLAPETSNHQHDRDPETENRSAHTNERPWTDEVPAGWVGNKDAITLAKVLGNDCEIDELRELDSRRLYKLLRKPGFQVQFMSTNKHRPKGRVCQSDWERYLRQRKEEKHIMESRVEQEVRKLI